MYVYIYLKADVGARMARAHASLAGLKSMSTTIAAEGIEDCRRCCGGHGYLVRGFSRRRWRRGHGFAHTQGDGCLFVGSFVVFIHPSIHPSTASQACSGLPELSGNFLQQVTVEVRTTACRFSFRLPAPPPHTRSALPSLPLHHARLPPIPKATTPHQQHKTITQTNRATTSS